MLFICNLLYTILNYVILIFAIVEVGFAVYCSHSLGRRRAEIRELTGESKKKQHGMPVWVLYGFLSALKVPCHPIVRFVRWETHGTLYIGYSTKSIDNFAHRCTQKQ